MKQDKFCYSKCHIIIDGVIKESNTKIWNEVIEFLRHCDHVAKIVNKDSKVDFSHCGRSLSDNWVEPYISVPNGQCAKETSDELNRLGMDTYIDNYYEDEDDALFAYNDSEIIWTVTLPGIRLEKEINIEKKLEKD